MNSNRDLFANSHQPDHYKPLAKVLPVAEPIQNFVLSRARKGILEILGNAKGRLLDVCCGTGCLSRLLTDAGNEVVGVDSSVTVLHRAIKNRRASEFVLLDATKMTFQKEFDAAVISLALHEMEPLSREITWQRMHEAVKPGGRILVLDYAVSPQKTVHSRLARYLLKVDEQRFRRINPAHYENYLQFMDDGGIAAWVKRRKKNIKEERLYLGGNIGVIGVSA